eukprot:TRINITY_DN26065_c0_g1_i1.p1 TRINITY_DN26065_c0_g1~~TRINITY_DN26065_c0_g1_i1.p1  ORF type:complete len:182 (-),score=41.08 TRINITY_DN26065_c0_g1_i1:90-635(-)
METSIWSDIETFLSISVQNVSEIPKVINGIVYGFKKGQNFPHVPLDKEFLEVKINQFISVQEMNDDIGEEIMLNKAKDLFISIFNSNEENAALVNDNKTLNSLSFPLQFALAPFGYDSQKTRLERNRGIEIWKKKKTIFPDLQNISLDPFIAVHLYTHPDKVYKNITSSWKFLQGISNFFF